MGVDMAQPLRRGARDHPDQPALALVGAVCGVPVPQYPATLAQCHTGDRWQCPEL